MRCPPSASAAPSRRSTASPEGRVPLELYDLPAADLPPGSLYIVSLPIGNVEDITVRAIRILRSVSLVVAENRLRTERTLEIYKITTPVVSCRDFRDAESLSGMLESLAEGQTAALVCDCGTPLVADPGAAIASAALNAGLRVVPVPGASAVLAALVASGLITGKFAFEGFPPRSRTDRREYFLSLSVVSHTIVIYETRSYLVDTLIRLRDALGGDRRVCVARNITREAQSFFYGSLEEAHQTYRAPARGEYTLVIASGNCGIES